MAKGLFNIVPDEWARVRLLFASPPDNEIKISRKSDLGKTNNLTHSYIRVANTEGQFSIFAIDHITKDQKYQEYLGHGSFSQVKLISDQNGNQYALKIKKIILGKNHESLYRNFIEEQKKIKSREEKEILILRKLGRFIAHFEKNGIEKDGARNHKFYIIESYIPGETLDKCIRQSRYESLSERLVISYKIAEKLNILNDVGIAHLDIKPSNIMVSGEASNIEVTLVDFNTSDFIDANNVTSKGTPGYQAPEMYDIHESVRTVRDHQTDIFALGVLLGGGVYLDQGLTKTIPPFLPLNLISTSLLKFIKIVNSSKPEVSKKIMQAAEKSNRPSIIDTISEISLEIKDLLRAFKESNQFFKKKPFDCFSKLNPGHSETITSFLSSKKIYFIPEEHFINIDKDISRFFLEKSRVSFAQSDVQILSKTLRLSSSNLVHPKSITEKSAPMTPKRAEPALQSEKLELDTADKKTIKSKPVKNRKTIRDYLLVALCVAIPPIGIFLIIAHLVYFFKNKKEPAYKEPMDIVDPISILQKKNMMPKISPMNANVIFSKKTEIDIPNNNASSDDLFKSFPCFTKMRAQK